MIVTIHQPEHLVWLGFLHKAAHADLLVLLDTVQFEKNSFQNRNKIRSAQGSTWLTAPVVKKESHTTLIKDRKISYEHKWTGRYINLLKVNYGESPYFNDYFPQIKALIEEEQSHLANLNTKLIRWLLSCFEINTPTRMASELDLPIIQGGTQVTLQIAVEVGAKVYLSGPHGKNYLDCSAYEKEGIDVHFHEFACPEYTQLFDPFIPNLSAVDLLFNHGPQSKEILLGNASQS